MFNPETPVEPENPEMLSNDPQQATGDVPQQREKPTTERL